MTVLEAMCVNIPVLLRDLPIYENILFDFYSCEKDVKGFLKELKRLKDDKEHYKSCCENSLKGNRFYEKSSVLKMWDDFYTSVLK